MSVYKIMRDAEWRSLQQGGGGEASVDDARDGFVHLSKPDQVRETLRKHFRDEENLWLLEIEEAVLGPDLRWEPARDGELFPHLHRRLELADVSRAEPIHHGEPLPYDLS